MDMSEAMTRVHAAENAIVAGYNKIDDAKVALVALHRMAWEHAGLSPQDASARAKSVLKQEHDIRALIQQIQARFRTIERLTDEVVAAIAENEARRKSERSKLGA